MLVVVGYLAFYLVVGRLVGVLFGDQLEDDVLASATSIAVLVLPIAIGALALVLLTAWLGWLGVVFGRQPVPGRGWMWIAPVLVVAAIVGHLGTIDWARWTGAELMMIALLGVCVGVAEELATRGLVVKILRDAGHGERFVVVVSSALFALMHTINLLSGMAISTVAFTVLYTFGFGACMYFTMRVTGTIWAAIVLHGLTDPITFLASGGVDESVSDQGGAMSLLAVLATILLILFALVAVWLVRGSARRPAGARRPTSHERQSGQPWDASYADGPAPWDVGRPQPAVVRVAVAGGFGGAVLDVGCGTGENTLHIASLGLPVLGVDVAETALAMARASALDRGIDVELETADALALEHLGRSFDTVLDCGLFHTLDSDERRTYVASLASVTRFGGTLYVLCFGDQGPDLGPHPVTQEDLRTSFVPSTGWEIVTIEPDRVLTRYHDEDGAPGWFATVRRS